MSEFLTLYDSNLHVIVHRMPVGDAMWESEQGKAVQGENDGSMVFSRPDSPTTLQPHLSSSSSGRACSDLQDLQDLLPPRLLVHHGCRKFLLVQSSVLSQLVDVGLGWTSDGSASVARSPEKCIADDFFLVSPAMSCKSHQPLSDHRGDILEITTFTFTRTFYSVCERVSIPHLYPERIYENHFQNACGLNQSREFTHREQGYIKVQNLITQLHLQQETQPLVTKTVSFSC